MIPAITAQSLYSIMPLFLLLAMAGFSLMMEVFFKEKGRELNGILCLVGVVVTALWVWGWRAGAAPEIFAGSLSTDSYSLFCTLIFLAALFMALLLELGQEELRCGEVFSLTIFSVFGMCIMASSLDLFTVFLGLEIMSIAVYALAGAKRTDLLSNEAALKYFLLGAFSSGIFLYGIVLVYASCNSITFQQIALATTIKSSALFIAGMALILVGFGFKVALVPFHMWAPDVYEGSPTAVTAFMATGVKAGGFAGFIRVFLVAFPHFYQEWSMVLGVLAVLTMTLGNFAALSQKSFKRTLAYSSIAHAGYILFGLIGGSAGNAASSAGSALYYLMSYTFMTGGAFAALCAVDSFSDGEDLKRFRGLGYRRPLLSAALALFLFSLAGLPPTAGFVSKFYVFSSAFHAGFPVLVILAVLNSLVSLYYYLRPLVWMYMDGEEESAPRKFLPLAITVALAVAVFGTLSLGIFPALLTQMTQESTAAIFFTRPH